MPMKPSFYVVRRDQIGRTWFAKRNGFHPNGKLSFTWTPSYDCQSCLFSKGDAMDIKSRQDGAPEVRRAEATPRHLPR